MLNSPTKKILLIVSTLTCLLIIIFASKYTNPLIYSAKNAPQNNNNINSAESTPSQANNSSAYTLPEKPINDELSKKLRDKSHQFASNNQPEKNSIYLGYFEGQRLLYYYSEWKNDDGKVNLYSGGITTSNGGVLDDVDFRKISEPKVIYQDSKLSGIGGFKFTKDNKSVYIVVSYEPTKNYPYGFSEVIKITLENKDKSVIWPSNNTKLATNPIDLLENYDDKYLLLSTTVCSYGDGVECDPYKISGKQIILNLDSHKFIELPGSYGEIKVYPKNQKYSYKQQEYKKVYIGKACFDRCTSSGCIIDSNQYECHAGGYGSLWVSIGNELFENLP